MYIDACIYIHIYYIRIYIYIYVCMYICIYTYIYVCVSLTVSLVFSLMCTCLLSLPHAHTHSLFLSRCLPPFLSRTIPLSPTHSFISFLSHTLPSHTRVGEREMRVCVREIEYARECMCV